MIKIQNKLNYPLITVLLLFQTIVFSQDKSGKIEELVKKYFEMQQFNGTVLVAEGDKIIYSGGAGFADAENKILNKPDTKFRLASVTKQFTATLIMQLVEKGKISLDGTLSEYLPYYRKDTGDKITIHQILSHTAGLGNYTDDNKFMQDKISEKVNPKDFILTYCSGELAYEPGTDWAYSNSGYFILGAVIEEVTGKTYEQVLQENILDPAGMTNSGLEHSDKTYDNFAKGYVNELGELKPAIFIEMSIPFSAGSVYSTAEDMYKWDRILYTEKLLSNASKEKMFTPVKNNYGYGWGILEFPAGDKKLKSIAHSGGIFGFNSLITRLTDDNKFIMVLNNFENGNIKNLTSGIVNILYGLEAPEPKMSLASELAKSIHESGLADAVAKFETAADLRDLYRVNEGEMNMLGYNFLQSGKTAEAVEVFKLNTALYPESSNVYDSLGEAYLAAGDNENALINYRKSVELDPNNENGKKIVKQLEEK